MAIAVSSSLSLLGPCPHYTPYYDLLGLVLYDDREPSRWATSSLNSTLTRFYTLPSVPVVA
ncbi:hypothetical protein C8R43DRAFT_1232198 [Mycena crocata]|nr:hypothetical protein C8R43DRAFT_1232198 [Mycena crocata]